VSPARRLALLFLHNDLVARAALLLAAQHPADLLLKLRASDCPNLECVGLGPRLKCG
jgi:hypothetical protein